jgi:hypothetical protein
MDSWQTLKYQLIIINNMQLKSSGGKNNMLYLIIIICSLAGTVYFLNSKYSLIDIHRISDLPIIGNQSRVGDVDKISAGLKQIKKEIFEGENFKNLQKVNIDDINVNKLRPGNDKPFK